MSDDTKHELVRHELDIMTLGDVLVKSGFFKDSTHHAQAVVKVLFGRELGLSPISSMTGIHIVEGKPELSSHLLASAIKSSGKYDYRVREHTNESCTIDFFQIFNGKKEKCGDHTFTIEDASRAQLSGKQNYKRYPKAMLFNRCLSAGYKLHCPDAISAGMPVYAEGEIGGRDLEQLKTVDEPKPAEKPKPVAAEVIGKVETKPAAAAPAVAAPAKDPEREAVLGELRALCAKAPKDWHAQIGADVKAAKDVGDLRGIVAEIARALAEQDAPAKPLDEQFPVEGDGPPMAT